MGYFYRVQVVFACLWLAVASVPARRAFNTSPADGNNLAGSFPITSNVDGTIKEVERLLSADPTLPRLTRGEILDIIENLTRSDLQNAFTGGHRDQKAIMVVMPYSADNVQNGDIQSLYTRPPITKLIGESTNDKQVEMKKRRPTKKPYQPAEANYLDFKPAKVAKVPSTTERVYVEEQYQQQVVTEVVNPKLKTTTENPITKFIRRRKTTKIPGQQKVQFTSPVTTTTTTTSTTTTAPRTTRRRKVSRRTTTIAPVTTTNFESEVFMPHSGINIIDPPSFHPKPETPRTTPKPEIPRITTQKPITRLSSIAPTIASRLPSTTPQPVVVDDMQIPEDFKQVLKSLDILIKQSPTEATLTTIPEQLTEEDKLRLLIASLGAQTSTTTSTTTAEPDVIQVANNLTPEMKELLMTFGLIPDPNKDKTTTPKVDTFMEPSSVVNPDSYSSFKPLPASSNNPNEDMEDFLAKFGLVEQKGGKRGQKAISMSKPGNDLPIPNLDVIPDQFKGVIADIGLADYKPTTQKVPAEKKKPEHVFVPPVSTDTEYASEDEIARLNKLMAVIKEFEKLNGTATEEDLKHIDLDGLKNLVNSFNVPLDEQPGPNPLDYDIGLIKNEVKRQTSTTEKAPDNLALLEDSFGGSSDTAETAETTTTEAPKRTGFYYLVDWNTFLDIDNQKGKRVNLRFQPKIGDPKRFLSVSVP